MMFYCNQTFYHDLCACYNYYLNRNEEGSNNIPKSKNDKHLFSSLVHSHKIIFHDDIYHFRPFKDKQKFSE